MAAIKDTVTIKTTEYRPCYVKDKKALFHRWEEKSEIVVPSPMVGGHGGGVVKGTLAIVEYEDGTIDEVRPQQIRFADDKINEYAFIKRTV